MIVDYGVFVEPPVIINQYILLPSGLGVGLFFYFFFSTFTTSTVKMSVE